MLNKKIKLFDSFEHGLEMVPENEVKLLKVKGKNFCIVSLHSEFHVVDNRCPHLGFNMHKGHLNPFGQIICPLHSE